MSEPLDTTAPRALAPVGARVPARRRVTTVFFVHGLVFASWTAHIPAVKSALRLSDARLGLALLGTPLGSVAAIVVVAPALGRFGSRRTVPVALLGYGIAGIAVGLSHSPLTLFAALALWGAFQGSLDVAMNTQGIAVETAVGRPIMSGLHAAWSIGSFAGAGIGALAVTAGVSLTAQLLVLGPLAAAGALGVPGRLLADRPHPTPGRAVGPAQVLRHPAVVVLGLIALAGMLCEGAAADWSAVYLRTSLGAGAGLAGSAYAVFAAAMVIVRLTGDRLLATVRARVLLPALAALATVGMALALVLAMPVAGLAGFAALGIGLGLVVPTAFSAAGRLPGIPTASALATVSAIGWVGFVGGPPLIGRLAGAVTLPGALTLVPVLTAAIALTVRGTRVMASAQDAAPSRAQ